MPAIMLCENHIYLPLNDECPWCQVAKLTATNEQWKKDYAELNHCLAELEDEEEQLEAAAQAVVNKEKEERAKRAIPSELGRTIDALATLLLKRING